VTALFYITTTMTKHRTIIGTMSTMGPLLLGLILLLSVSTAAAYQQPSPVRGRTATDTGNRREYLAGLLTTATTAALLTASAATVALLPVQPANAVLGSGACASGVGEGCGDRSDGNEYIRSLQEKSAVNKDMYMRVRASPYHTHESTGYCLHVIICQTESIVENKEWCTLATLSHIHFLFHSPYLFLYRNLL
jgi:hypothetical protein